MKEGVRIVHTAIPPLANGSSQPSVFNVVGNLRALGYKPLVNLDALPPVREHFSWIAKREGLPVGAPREFDQAWYGHQVPGGMISNLRHQLKLMGKEEKLQEVLEETAQVRAELGYPIMVTPFAQFVGSQAAINVILGERYKEVTDPVIQYALGLWGKEGSDHMDAAVKAKILDRPRAREIEKIEYPEPTLEEVRKQYGGRTFVGRRIAVALLRGSGVCRCSKRRAAEEGISRRASRSCVWSKSLAKRNWGTSISARATSLSPSKERNNRVAGEFFHVQSAIDATPDANKNRAQRRQRPYRAAESITVLLLARRSRQRSSLSGRLTPP